MGESKIDVVAIRSLSELVQTLTGLSDSHYFRGMASANWRLKTSVDRLLDRVRQGNNSPLLSDTNQNLVAEMYAQVNFIKRQSANLNRLFGRSTDAQFILDDSNFLHMPVILQHYGYPTRIQDWTESWKIAMFFCLEDTTQSGDMALWAIERANIPDVESCLGDSKYLYSDPLSKNNRIDAFYNLLVPGVYRVQRNFFKRITAQRGVVLVTGRGARNGFCVNGVQTGTRFPNLIAS